MQSLCSINVSTKLFAIFSVWSLRRVHIAKKPIALPPTVLYSGPACAVIKREDPEKIFTAKVCRHSLLCTAAKVQIRVHTPFMGLHMRCLLFFLADPRPDNSSQADLVNYPAIAISTSGYAQSNAGRRWNSRRRSAT